MAKFKTGQIVIYDNEPYLYSIESVIEFPNAGVFYSIKKINSNEAPELTLEEYLTLAKNDIKKEDKPMAITANKSYDYTATPEKVAKLREEYKAAKAKKERDAKAKELHDKYQSLIDAGFSTEQAYDILQTKMKMDEF